ncbi:hypothetical protein PTSG_00563 [Salpingoeca rosetta]|uniref:Uncharacterized protein n=1 Tax=Salpingoeca rosetta (strain ATCC 50818 / BSB-021) TaxID=946362 RepID=F2TWU4_SALR5|nr:uncharacterized protein PTSG_00563 [Salpingoeca rosetta]EGD72540.1 hypothetical protein PTSG_00563 [Salpingoeca rosetta]|eukprot:XP_004999109.1 hypothetical protein PTSG_00563 [Salpingoeca rosetta]
MLEWSVTVAEPVVLTGETVRLRSIIRNTTKAAGTATADTGHQASGGQQTSSFHGTASTAASSVTNTTTALSGPTAASDTSSQSGNAARVVSGYRPVHFERDAHAATAGHANGTAPGGTLSARPSAGMINGHATGHGAATGSGGSRHVVEGTEAIACAIIQVVCQMAGNPSRVDMHKTETPTTSYSFTPASQAKGMVVFASVPVILFCDLQLAPGESRQDDVSVKIAQHAPPTYKGDSISYIYRVVGGLQRFEHPTRYAHLPIKVLAVPEKVRRQCARGSATSLPIEDAINGLESPSSSCSRPTQPHSPFVPRSVPTETRDHILRAIASLTRRRAPCVFRLRNSKGAQIAGVSLSKLSYRLGETVELTVSLEESEVTVVQVNARLVSREVVRPAHRLAGITDELATTSTTHASTTLHTSVTLLESVGLPIPLVSHTNFETQTVSVEWMIEVDLAYRQREPSASVQPTQAPGPATAAASSSSSSTAPAPSHSSSSSSPAQQQSSATPDHVRWTTALEVLPANPINIPFKAPPLSLQW